jgi:hypothetical protein
VYVVQFMRELYHLIVEAHAFNETTIMLTVLGLIDVVMISNLLSMVIIGGYETFISRTQAEIRCRDAPLTDRRGVRAQSCMVRRFPRMFAFPPVTGGRFEWKSIRPERVAALFRQSAPLFPDELDARPFSRCADPRRSRSRRRARAREWSTRA